MRVAQPEGNSSTSSDAPILPNLGQTEDNDASGSDPAADVGSPPVPLTPSFSQRPTSSREIYVNRTVVVET